MEQLKNFIHENGFDFEPIIDGQFHEFKDQDKKGWFVGSEVATKTGKTHVVFTFGDFRNGEKFVFSSKDSPDAPLTDAEKREISKKQKELEVKAKAEREKKHAQVAKRIAAEWPTFSETFKPTNYTQKKAISALHGARLEASSMSSPNLIIPMQDIHGKIWGYQTIQDDGQKFFQPGQRMTGLFHLIGELENYIYLTEGFATGVSVHEATGKGVVVAFNAGNLDEVAKEIRLKYPKLPIVICADNDCYKDSNIGLESANKAASNNLCSVVLPEFLSKTTRPTDWNDLHLLEGLGVVKHQLEQIKIIPPEEVIKTERQGFHTQEPMRGGGIRFTPQYEDLRKFFQRSHTYKMLGSSKICYVWDGKKYSEFPEIYIDNFSQKHFSPVADNKMCAEFRGLVLRTNLETPEWFQRTTERKINFQNSVLDIDTLEILNHSPDCGFRYVLEYDYDPLAKCPTFDKFLDDITQHNKKLQESLLEFMGYAISNDSCWAQKALILDGTGKNGKSTFINILKALAGKENYTPLAIVDLGKEGNRQMLDGKLFNIAEETPTKGMTDSSIFKALVGGGEVQVRQLYKGPYKMKNRAKMIFACNELPESQDKTNAFLRRLLIIPFTETFSFSKGNRDPHIEEKILKELPGIFNRVIEAYKRLYKNQQFSLADKSIDALNNYHDSIDPVISWVNESVEAHPLGNGKDTNYNLLSDIYQEYRRYMEANGFKPLNKIHFGRRLASLIPEYQNRMYFVTLEGHKQRALKATTLYGKAKF